jgi:hypothetical protein
METIFAVDPEGVYDYIPESARGLLVEDQPVFQLAFMSARESEEIQNSINTTSMKDGAVIHHTNTGTVTLKSLIAGVRGWRNLKYQDGRETPFRENAGRPSAKTFDCLPFEWKRELAEVITTGNGLSEQAEKNSGSQSPGN